MGVRIPPAAPILFPHGPWWIGRTVNALWVGSKPTAGAKSGAVVDGHRWDHDLSDERCDASP